MTERLSMNWNVKSVCTLALTSCQQLGQTDHPCANLARNKTGTNHRDHFSMMCVIDLLTAKSYYVLSIGVKLGVVDWFALFFHVCLLCEVPKN